MVESADDFHERFVKVMLGDKNLFEMFIGRRVLKKEVKQEGDMPIYSANVFEPMGYGTYDLERQRVIADRFMLLQEKAKEIERRKDWLNSRLESYLNENRWAKKA